MVMRLVRPQSYKTSPQLSNLSFTCSALVSITMFQTLCASLSVFVTAVLGVWGFVWWGFFVCLHYLLSVCENSLITYI